MNDNTNNTAAQPGTITWTDEDESHDGFTHFLEAYSGNGCTEYSLYTINQRDWISRTTTHRTSDLDSMRAFVAANKLTVARPE
jgi:hypothetical protein